MKSVTRFDTLLARHTARELAREERDARPTAVIDPERVVPLSEAVIVADHSFVVQAANDAAAHLLRWPDPYELVRDLNQVPWSIFGAQQLREIQVALVMRGRWSGSVALLCRDGEPFEAFVTACSLHAGRDVPAGVVVTIRPQLVAPSAGELPTDAEAFGVRGLPGSFCLHYQPEVDLRSGAIAGCEALLRWWHPGLGLVSPGPALAHPKWSARLAGLETWSIFAACRQAMAWERGGARLPVALNVSANLLADPELVNRVRQALVVTGMAPGMLVVDVPVAAAAGASEAVRRVTTDLADLGVTVAIDGVRDARDQVALAQIPASVYKIIPEPVSEAGVVGLRTAEAVGMAQTRGATTVAKSVETTTDLQAAQRLGFDRAFGHIFSPALSSADLARTLGGGRAIGRATAS